MPRTSSVTKPHLMGSKRHVMFGIGRVSAGSVIFYRVHAFKLQIVIFFLFYFEILSLALTIKLQTTTQQSFLLDVRFLLRLPTL